MSQLSDVLVTSVIWRIKTTTIIITTTTTTTTITMTITMHRLEQLLYAL